MELPLNPKEEKEDAMKQQALRTIATLGFLLMLTALPAYSQAEQLRANIPFPFIVGEKTLPAGTYRVEGVRRDSKLLWVIQQRESRGTAVFITTPIRSVTQEEAKLVFHRYGEEYFLAQIWSVGGNTGREVAETQREHTVRRELAKNAKKDKVAQGASKAETVVLTAGQP